MCAIHFLQCMFGSGLWLRRRQPLSKDRTSRNCSSFNRPTGSVWWDSPVKTCLTLSVWLARQDRWSQQRLYSFSRNFLWSCNFPGKLKILPGCSAFSFSVLNFSWIWNQTRTFYFSHEHWISSNAACRVLHLVLFWFCPSKASIKIMSADFYTTSVGTQLLCLSEHAYCWNLLSDPDKWSDPHRPHSLTHSFDVNHKLQQYQEKNIQRLEPENGGRSSESGMSAYSEHIMLLNPSHISIIQLSIK